ncbi:MAG: ribonuclease Z [Bacteroidales bacterium]|nr:ribonuclease Z [Bacteroidales bacterium]
MTFELTILGSSSAVPTSRRNLTAHVLNVHERFFLIDCGEGTQLQIRKNKIRLGKINHIFISHLHGDHLFGLFGLISTFSLLNRQMDLHIYAHPELERILNHHINYFERTLPFQIIYHSLDPKNNEIIYEDKRVTVETIPLKHRIPTCGFLFKEKPHERNLKKNVVSQFNLSIREILSIKDGSALTLADGSIIPNHELTLPPYKQRSYAYCTDTAYSEKIIPLIKEVDLLFHEATFTEQLSHQAKQTFHSTAKQAAIIAQKARAKKLIIGHFSARYKDITPLVEEANSIFTPVFPAEDGEKYVVGLERNSSNDNRLNS